MDLVSNDGLCIDCLCACSLHYFSHTRARWSWYSLASPFPVDFLDTCGSCLVLTGKAEHQLLGTARANVTTDFLPTVGFYVTYKSPEKH